MAKNDFYTPEQAAVVAATIANEDSTIAALVSRNFQNDLMGGGKGGAPVAVKMPTTLVARERGIDEVTTKIVLDEIAETTTTVNLDRTHVYSAVGLSEADLTLNLTDFSGQVLAPQASAVVDDVEARVLRKIEEVDETDLGVAFDPDNPVHYFTALRKHMRKNGVPTAGLNVLVGVDVYAALLDAKAIDDASQSGSTAALRDAAVGRLRGMTVVETTRVPDTGIYAFHRDAVTLVTRAPVKPAGVAFGATVSEKGYSLRYMRDYDADHTQDRSIVSTFAGVGLLPTWRIKRGADGRRTGVEQIPNGGIFRANVADAEGDAGA